MIPGLSLAASGSGATGGTSDSGSGTNVFGDIQKSPDYAGGGKGSVVGGGTGIGINIPINFGESQENTNKFDKLTKQAVSDPTGTNNYVMLFGLVGIVGIFFALLARR